MQAFSACRASAHSGLQRWSSGTLASDSKINKSGRLRARNICRSPGVCVGVLLIATWTCTNMICVTFIHTHSSLRVIPDVHVNTCMILYACP